MRWGLAVRGAAAVAVVLASGVVGIPAVDAIAQTSGGETEEARASHAQAEAEVLLSDLRLPEGAQPASSDPSVGQALTVARAFSRAPGPSQAQADRFWRVPGEPREVITWLEASVPVGATLSIRTGGPLGGPLEQPTTGFRFTSTQPDVFDEEELVIVAMHAEGGGTALRVEGEVAWLPVRPPSEWVPAHVKLIRIVEHKTDVRRETNSFSRSTTVRRQTVVKNVIAAVEALERPATHLGYLPVCGHIVGSTMIEVQFRETHAGGTARKARPLRCGVRNVYPHVGGAQGGTEPERRSHRRRDPVPPVPARSAGRGVRKDALCAY